MTTWLEPQGDLGGHGRRQVEVRFTANDDAVHAIVFAGPISTADPRDAVTLPVEARPGTAVELPGHRGPVAWEPTVGGIRVTLPEAPTGAPAIALRMSPPAAIRPRADTTPSAR